MKARVLAVAFVLSAAAIKVFRHTGAVRDVIGYLSSSDSPLAGRTWRLVLSSYACDPGTGASPACAATTDYPTRPRHGPPPIENYCRLPNGDTDTAPPGCHNTLAAEYASQGDWPAFDVSRGYRPTGRTGLCVSEQLRSGAAWNSPSGALQTLPVRACSEVTS